MKTTGKGSSQPVQPGKTAEWEVPENVELWFNVQLDIETRTDDGNVTFGPMIRTQGYTYYPMPNNGFKTVEADDISIKGNPPIYGAVAFFGQCVCGTLSVVNNTAYIINVLPLWSARKIVE